MQKLFIIISFIFIHSFCAAQDTIIKYSGDILIVKVIEINATEVKYKRFDFLQGPTYVNNKTDILVVKFANGLKEFFDRNPNSMAGGQLGNGANFNPGQIIIRGRYYYFMNNRGLGYSGLQKEMYRTGDPQLIGLMKESKKSFRLSFSILGFIPLGVAAIACASQSEYGNSTQTVYTALGIVCGAAAIACPIYGFWQRHNCINYNAKAVRLYNEKY